MIKIIISGTYDGFSPRYATDGNLNDTVSQQLLDRRRFLTRESDRLYKDGYSFQQVEGGILYHKIILLFDGFGRDGFMMASLFLPDGEMLDGKDIKETLDAIIKDYKARIQNGIVNVELDWSFVKRRADELNTKVQAVSWGKHPSNGNASKTALMQGAENRIEEFFQFPHPLNSAFEGYGQVFLTESILDPAMVSNDGEQGYKVLAADSVNIDNPEYTIVYDNQQSGARLEGERRSISKKELDQPYGTIPLGTYSRPGYRSQPVSIKAGTKSPDGFYVHVSLPILEQKSATVKLSIVNEKKGTVIPLSECTVLWSKSAYDNPIELTPSGNKFSFLGEDCDHRWGITVRHPLFNEYYDEILINDNGTETKFIRLSTKPGWEIILQLPNGKTKTFRNNVAEEDLKEQITAASRHLEDNGFVAMKSSQDTKAHTVTIIGREKDQYNYSVPSDSDTFNGSNQPQTDENKYFLRLNPKSKKYSLFKHPQLIDPKLSDEKGIKYDTNTHRLECICDKEPDNKEIKLGKDKFCRYSIPHPKWNKEPMWEGPSSFVKRKLQKNTKILLGIALVVVVLGAALVVFLIWRNRENVEISILKDTMISQSAQMNTYPNSYCGDSLFFKAKETKGQYENLLKDNPQLKDDSVHSEYNKFCNLFAKQSDYRIQDSTIYYQAIDMFESDTIPSQFDLNKWNDLWQKRDVLTKEHHDTLDCRYQNYLQKLEAEANARQQAEEDALYNKCMGTNATLQDCEKYFAKFKDKNTRHYKDVAEIKEKLSQSPYEYRNRNNTQATNIQKEIIRNKDDLFNALTWENVKDNGKGFYEKYKAPEDKKNRVSRLIQKANKAGEAKYREAYEKAKKTRSQEANGKDKIYYIEIGLQ